MGSEALLERLLDRFLEDRNFPSLAAALECGDTDGAVQAAHTLKGVCGNLSMNGLYRLFTRQVELLRTLAERYQEAGNLQLCLDTLHKITAVEPDNEEVAQAIMETYLRLGDRVGAIRYYKQFEGVLWNDLNISPNESLRELYNRLKGGESHRSAHARVPSPSEGHFRFSLMVLSGSSRIEDSL